MIIIYRGIISTYFTALTELIALGKVTVVTFAVNSVINQPMIISPVMRIR